MAYAREGAGSQPPFAIAEKMKPFLILKQTDFSSCGACRNCCFFCSVQLSNLTSRNFHYDAADAICNNTGSSAFMIRFA